MPNLPLILSIVAAAVAIVFFLLRSRRVRRSDALIGRRRQVLIEDSLKHLHDVEYRGHSASLESLAGALEVRADRAAALVATLESRRLLDRRGTALHLTDGGRKDARRILRMHRLWERWLAEETGVSETRWHALAEKREHRMTDAEVEELSARLGHPAWDPHGDPIPTASGELPPRRGAPLPSLGENEWAVIVHLEDEPEALYEELVDAELHIGKTIRLITSDASRVRLESDGCVRELSPVAAANITVAAMPSAPQMAGAFETLAALPSGESAEVVEILPGCVGAQRRRLLDLGLVPGTRVEAVMSSAAGNPMAFRIRGSLIALRRDQARWVRIADGTGKAAA